MVRVLLHSCPELDCKESPRKVGLRSCAKRCRLPQISRELSKARKNSDRQMRVLQHINVRVTLVSSFIESPKNGVMIKCLFWIYFTLGSSLNYFHFSQKKKKGVKYSPVLETICCNTKQNENKILSCTIYDYALWYV